ncbi:MAG: hypothetical protein F6K31_20150 [Symploca sp. SIO2G7]|nr:hypothetical protein [Symploca sp. SIO2G7]
MQAKTKKNLNLGAVGVPRYCCGFYLPFRQEGVCHFYAGIIYHDLAEAKTALNKLRKMNPSKDWEIIKITGPAI